MIERVTNGMGAMPSFSGSLSDEQIAAVADYVVQEHRRLGRLPWRRGS